MNSTALRTFLYASRVNPASAIAVVALLSEESWTSASLCSCMKRAMGSMFRRLATVARGSESFQERGVFHPVVVDKLIELPDQRLCLFVLVVFECVIFLDAVRDKHLGEMVLLPPGLKHRVVLLPNRYEMLLHPAGVLQVGIP